MQFIKVNILRINLLKDEEENEFLCSLHSCCFQILMLSRAEFHNAENLHMVDASFFAKCKYPLEMLGIGTVYCSIICIHYSNIVHMVDFKSKAEVSFPVLRSAHFEYFELNQIMVVS